LTISENICLKFICERLNISENIMDTEFCWLLSASSKIIFLNISARSNIYLEHCFSVWPLIAPTVLNWWFLGRWPLHMIFFCLCVCDPLLQKISKAFMRPDWRWVSHPLWMFAILLVQLSYAFLCPPACPFQEDNIHCVISSSLCSTDIISSEFKAKIEEKKLYHFLDPLFDPSFGIIGSFFNIILFPILLKISPNL
jgi:hypothetical protein